MMIKRVTLIIVFTGLITINNKPIRSDEILSRGLVECAVIIGDLDRLSCFDDFSAKLGLTKPQVEPVDIKGTGDWVVQKSKNPLNDSERVVVFLEAKSGVSRWGNPIEFVARCDSDKTEVYINWGDYLGDDSRNVYSDWKYVTIRIGDHKSVKQQWPISTDKKATFAPNWAGDLLKKMVQSRAFIAQTTPYGENPITAVFETKGLSNALVPLMEACGWELE